MTPEDDWTTLSDTWTAPAPDDGALASLAGNVRRRALFARINFYVEIASCTAAVVLGGWLVVSGEGVGVAALLFGLFAGALTLWARGARDPSPMDTPAQALKAAIRQAEAGRRWARGGVAVTVAASIFVGVMAASTPGPILWPLYGVMALLLLGCLVFQLRHHDRCVARIRTFQQALDALN